MSFEDKIKELNLNLPDARDPVGSYVASKIIGKMLFISGQISIAANGELIKGKVGSDLKTEDKIKMRKKASSSQENTTTVKKKGGMTKQYPKGTKK